MLEIFSCAIRASGNGAHRNGLFFFYSRVSTSFLSMISGKAKPRGSQQLPSRKKNDVSLSLSLSPRRKSDTGCRRKRDSAFGFGYQFDAGTVLNPLNVNPNKPPSRMFAFFFPSFFLSQHHPGGEGEEVKKKLQKWVIIWLSAVKRPPGKQTLGQRGAHNIPDLEPCGMR